VVKTRLQSSSAPYQLHVHVASRDANVNVSSAAACDIHTRRHSVQHAASPARSFGLIHCVRWAVWWFFSIVVQCRKVYLFSGICSNRLLYLFFGSRIWFWLEMYALFYISYFMIPFPPAGNIWAIMIVQSIRGKIIRTFLCCIMYGSCAEWYAHTYAVLKLDCWFRFRFSLDVSLVLSVFAILFLCCLL